MEYNEVKEDLIDSGLHDDSVTRLLDHYAEIRSNLAIGHYASVGTHVGNFCENATNILREYFGDDVESTPAVGTFVDQCEANQLGAGSPVSIRLTIPRLIRAAYELRSRRDTVHTNLELPVNHLDSQTSAQLCTWILGEMIREFGSDDDLDSIAGQIESLTQIPTPGIDVYDGQALVTSSELNRSEEILVLLDFADEPVPIEKLADWIPGGHKASIGGSLGRMKQGRLVRYDDGIAIITEKGRRKANEIVRDELS